MSERTKTTPPVAPRHGPMSTEVWISEQLKKMAEGGATAPAASDATGPDEEILRWIRRQEECGSR